MEGDRTCNIQLYDLSVEPCSIFYIVTTFVSV